MGQILSWIRGTPSREPPGLRDVSVEDQSQSGQTAPKPAAPVSTYETATASTATRAEAAKPTTPATTTAATTAPAKPATTTAATTAPAKPATTTAATTAPAKPATTTAATTAPAKPATTTAATTAPAKPATTTAATTAPAKPATTSTTAKATAAAQTKVQVEVPPSKVKDKQVQPEVDPLDALAGFLPSEAASRPEPKYTGPEVKEGVTSEKGVRVGEREDTLPPGYRAEDMPPVPADVKPKDVPKPISTDDALDVLSAGFGSSSETPKKEKSHQVETVSAPKTARSNFTPAPPAGKKPEAVAPPADKKAKIETASDSFSLNTALPKEKSPAAAPLDKKHKTDTKTQPTSPSLDMSLDALSALGGMLPTAEVTPEAPPVRPEDIVPEDKVKKEKGVRVGEREDTLPPEYRFKEDDLKKHPAPPQQPSLDTDEALDLLSGDFSAPSSAPSTQAIGKPYICKFPARQPQPMAPEPEPPVLISTPGGAKQSDEDLALEALSGDFVAPSAAPTVQSSACPPIETSEPLTPGADSALDALSDALKDIAPTPKPEAPMPTNIVKEKTIEEERLIKMGERDDTLPPEYRPTEEDKKKWAEEKKKVPESPKEKPMDEDTAMDLLSGDLSDPVSAAGGAVTTTTQAGATHTEKPMAGPVLQSLSDTLLPEKVKSKSDKPKKPVTDEPSVPSAPPSTDLVSKTGGKS